jgi:fatty acid desaturase
VLGTLALAAAKSIENMELGHNIGHGQWDWMNDPEIHSTTWEWDMAGLSSQWRYSHSYRHHMFTNVVGVDDDVGYGILRVTRYEQCGSPVKNYLLFPALAGRRWRRVLYANAVANPIASLWAYAGDLLRPLP